MEIKRTIRGSGDAGFEAGAGKSPKHLFMLGGKVALPADEVTCGQMHGHDVASPVVPPQQEAVLHRDYYDLSNDHSSDNDFDNDNCDDDEELVRHANNLSRVILI
ncbi:hypothetical protein D1007_50775 [Hordeum vulgare]|nr:hypothetical protein D1007_50775 [Hordeum vulgare]